MLHQELHHTFSFNWFISAVAMLCLSWSWGKKKIEYFVTYIVFIKHLSINFK